MAVISKSDLDIMNLGSREEALSRFEGALLVISHDLTFLKGIGAADERHPE
jgi:ATPase subunit of ABC transporter with duplicated ATPase domains